MGENVGLVIRFGAEFAPPLLVNWNCQVAAITAECYLAFQPKLEKSRQFKQQRNK